MITREQAIDHFNRMQHGPLDSLRQIPTVNVLIDFLLHQLQPEQERAVAAHVCGCKKCQLFVRAWEAAVKGLQGTHKRAG